jgi:thiol-disulfide isomerase/thioredoxin
MPLTLNRYLHITLLALGLLAGACPNASAAPANPPAPEFRAGLPWLNVSAPLSLEKLRGKVVLLDFWTYGCVNCMHVIPDLEKLERKYGNKLAVIGVHSPKFDNEKNIETLRNIVVRYELAHAVVNDVDFTLWKRYGVNAWPTQVLIDPDGGVVGGVSGEGQYATLDRAIGDLVASHSSKLNEKPLPIALERDKLAKSFLAAPGKVATGKSASGEGMVAIADTLHHRIVVTDATGKVKALIGGGRGFADGGFDTTRFLAPQGMSFGKGPDGDSGLYVADTGNHAIRFIDFAKRTVTTLAGTGQRVWSVKGERKAKGSGLASPWDVLWRPNELFIAMAGTHQIWRMDLATGRIGPFAGSGREDIADGALASAAFSQPSGLALHGEKLYVADAEDSAVRVIDLKKRRVDTLVGTGLFDFGDVDGDFKSAKLQHVLGVAVLDTNRVVIADTYNHRVKQLDLGKRRVTGLAGSGKPAKGEGALNEPGGLAVLDGRVLIADTNNHRIAVFDPKDGSLRAWGVTP